MKDVITGVKRTFDPAIIMNNSDLLVIVISMDITCATVHKSATLDL